jgi:hypothetical protein
VAVGLFQQHQSGLIQWGGAVVEGIQHVARQIQGGQDGLPLPGVEPLPLHREIAPPLAPIPGIQSQVQPEQAGQPLQAMHRRDPPLQNPPIMQSGQERHRIGDAGAAVEQRCVTGCTKSGVVELEVVAALVRLQARTQGQ